MVDDDLEVLRERIAALDRLTDAKFVTMAQLVEAQAAKVELALNAAEKAITKADQATEKRFDAVNEFRSTLSDQAASFVTRAEQDGVEKEIVQLGKAQSRTVGIAVGASTAVTLIGVLLSIVLRLATGN